MLFVADGFFLVSLLRARLNRQQSLRHSVEMTDRGPPLVLSNRSHNAQTNHDLRVDNIGIVSDHVAEVHVALKESKQDCEKGRLMLHVFSVSSVLVEPLGFELNVEQLRTLPTVVRFGRIRKRLRCCLNRRRVAG